MRYALDSNIVSSWRPTLFPVSVRLQTKNCETLSCVAGAFIHTIHGRTLRKSSYLIMLPIGLRTYHRTHLQWYISLAHRVSISMHRNAMYLVLHVPVVDDRDTPVSGASKPHPLMGNPFMTRHLSHAMVLLMRVPLHHACDPTFQATSPLHHDLTCFSASVQSTTPTFRDFCFMTTCPPHPMTQMNHTAFLTDTYESTNGVPHSTMTEIVVTEDISSYSLPQTFNLPFDILRLSKTQTWCYSIKTSRAYYPPRESLSFMVRTYPIYLVSAVCPFTNVYSTYHTG
jgi:hypothetical protein